jgi:hypothetical protein
MVFNIRVEGVNEFSGVKLKKSINDTMKTRGYSFCLTQKNTQNFEK